MLDISLNFNNKPLETLDESIAATASAKLEDGDVKGAVRVLCSDDRLTVPDNTSFAEFVVFILQFQLTYVLLRRWIYRPSRYRLRLLELQSSHFRTAPLEGQTA